MRIVTVERYPIGFTRRPGGAGLAPLPARSIIVRIRTDSGLTGLGEAAVDPSDVGRTFSTLSDWLKGYEAALVGADALNLNLLHHRLDQVSGRHPPGCQAARAAIDMAAHDLVGKARDCPVHELLGGSYRTACDLRADISDEAEAAAAVYSAVAGGYRAVKVSIAGDLAPGPSAAPDFERQVRFLVAVLAAAGSTVQVDADAGQSLGNPALARTMVEGVLAERFHPNLGLQQPLHRLDLAGHALLREKLPIPVILDDSVSSPEAMMQIVRLGAADRIVLDIERVGGLQNAMRIADICETAAIGVSPASTANTRIGDAAHCHLAAALHDPYPIDVGGYLRFGASPVGGGFDIRNGRAVLADGPGLGVDLDEDALRSMSMDG